MLHQVSVLVAEREPVIAMEIETMISDARGLVVGPAHTLQSAMELLESKSINAAVVGLHMPDGDVSDLMNALSERSIPMLIQSGADLAPDIHARYPSVPLVRKPYTPAEFVTTLRALLSATRPI